MYFIEKNAAPFREGEVSPSLQTQGFPLPPQRDGSVFFSAAVATLRRSPFYMPATPIGHEFSRFSARRKMGAFATKQKLEEQATACDMPSTPKNREFLRFFAKQKMEPSRPSKNSKSKQQLATCPQRPLDMSFCGFPQGGKWERSRPSKNSKSKRQLATCPQRPSKSRRQIALPKEKLQIF